VILTTKSGHLLECAGLVVTHAVVQGVREFKSTQSAHPAADRLRL